MSTSFPSAYPAPIDLTSFTNRNRLINGDMRVDQRNEGAVVAAAAAIVRFTDKWKFQPGAVGTFNVQRNTATPPAGFTHYLTFTVTNNEPVVAAGNAYALQHIVEPWLLQDFQFGTAGARNVALSFWVRSSQIGVFSGSIRSSAGQSVYLFPYSITVANTWQKITLSIPGDVSAVTWNQSGNGNGLFLTFDLGSGVNFTFPSATGASRWIAGNRLGIDEAFKLVTVLNATLDITGVQLELNNVASPFDYMGMGQQLALCQRYFSKSFAFGTAPAQNLGINTGETTFAAQLAGAVADLFTEKYPMPMRTTTPTLTFFNPAAANNSLRDETAGADGGAPAARWRTDRGFAATANGNAVTVAGNICGVHWTAENDY